MKFVTILTCSLLCILKSYTFCQADSSNSILGDSISIKDSSTFAVDSSEIFIEKYRAIVNESTKQSRADSLRKIELLEKIALLEERDRFKEAELIRQINEIEKKDSIRNSERNERILKMKQNTKGHPVAPFTDTLFYVYIKIGPILAQERAASTTQKIRLLYDDDYFESDSIKVVDNDATIDIMYQEMIIVSITDWDALWQNRQKLALANDLAKTINQAIVDEKQNNSLRKLLMRVGLALLIFVCAWILVFIINRLFKKLKLSLIQRKDKYLKGISIKNYELFPPERELDIVLSLINAIKWFVFIVILYVAIPIIFSLFPFTEGWAVTIFGWIKKPIHDTFNSIWNYLPNIFSILVIYFITRYTIKFIHFLANEIETGRLTLSGFHKDWAQPTFNIIKFLLYAFMFVVIFPYLPGSDSPVFQGVSVFLGILFSLGSSTAIANAVSGLVITYMRPFQIGDRVKIGDNVGTVIEKSLLVTRIKTIKNEYITVPNASVLTGSTVNYSTPVENNEGLVVHTTITIGYDVPWRKVHELLKTCARDTKDIIQTKDPFVLQTSLDDNYVSYQLNAYTNSPGKLALIYSELHEHIQDKFNEAGVEILSPHYRAMRDGNMITIPVDYLPEDYKIPGFKVDSQNSQD